MQVFGLRITECMHARNFFFFFFEGVAGWQSRLLSRLKKLNLMIVGQAALS
jgi:hypothetical protein